MAHAQSLDAVGESCRQVLAADELQEGALRVGVREHVPGAELLAAFQPHPDRAAALQQDSFHGGTRAVLDAVRAAGGGHRLGDGAHAAAGVAPGAALALELAERVMEVRDRGARGVEAREIAGHAVTGGEVAHRLALEPALRNLVRGRGQQLHERCRSSSERPRIARPAGSRLSRSMIPPPSAGGGFSHCARITCPTRSTAASKRFMLS